MARGQKIPTEEISMILGMFEAELRKGTPKMQIYAAIAKEHGIPQLTVEGVVRRYRPTVDIAKHTLLAGAHKLAERIIKKASVGEAIDVLSRSTIGVIAPKQEVGSGNIGFFINVQEESLGAVREGSTLTEAPRQALPAARGMARTSASQIAAEGIGVLDVEPQAASRETAPQGVYAKALARSKARLEAAKAQV
jgi:hypothetical protein